jgi:hypothetical protein
MKRELTHESTVRRLMRLYREATEAEKAHGLVWYDNEAEWIAALADCHGVSKTHAIAAYAALSPRLRLRQNRRAMIDLLDGFPRNGVFERSMRAATAALIQGSAVLRGPKVTRFACNLGGCRECVTLDVHASDIAGWDRGIIGTKGGYERLERAYKAAARRLGIHPSVLQATLWVKQRGTHS